MSKRRKDRSSWGDKIPGPESILVTVHVCTAEERAIIDAARKAQAALDTPGVPFQVMWEAAQELRAAIHAADAATEEGDAHVG